MSSLIRLNKFISNAGVCARRRADALISNGDIAVNGMVVRDIGTKIAVDSVVTYKGSRLYVKKLKYILLNKPKGYLTTVKDPYERRTVLDLVRCCKQRVYPVGRLDYDTTGLLLLTNDGLLAQRLAHPSSQVPKRYHVVLDKPISREHLRSIQEGVILDDGLALVDALTVLDKDLCRLSVVLHMGRTRIVRRIFQHVGYVVTQLDRVGYAHLTKQNLALGQWVFLNEKVVSRLSMA